MKVLVICARRYNGHELWTLLGVLHEAGLEFEVISTSTLIRDEITDQPNIIERTLDDVENIDEFDGLAFVSGNMKDTESHWDNPRALGYVRQAHARDIPIAAICCSVPIIREAVDGKKVSYFPLIRSTERLVNAGAIPQTVSITVDGKIVTAENQMGTQMWAEALVRVLNGEEVDLGLIDTHWMPGGREKKPDPDLQRLREISKRTGKVGVD
jgi:putative intracellular protease/amidase